MGLLLHAVTLQQHRRQRYLQFLNSIVMEGLRLIQLLWMMERQMIGGFCICSVVLPDLWMDWPPLLRSWVEVAPAWTSKLMKVMTLLTWMHGKLYMPHCRTMTPTWWHRHVPHLRLLGMQTMEDQNLFELHLDQIGMVSGIWTSMTSRRFRKAMCWPFVRVRLVNLHLIIINLGCLNNLIEDQARHLC